MSGLRWGFGRSGECWVAIQGVLDGPVSQSLRDRVAALLRQGCRRLVVDLRQTPVIESSGLGVLVEVLREMEALGGSLVVRPPPGQVFELSRLRRLGELLAAVDNAVEEAEAIRRLDRLVC